MATSLGEYLAPVLPSGGQFDVVRIACQPRESRAIVSHRGTLPLTIKSQELVLVRLVPPNAPAVPIFGLEVVVYLTITDCITRTVFVAKADTTGMCSLRLARVKVGVLTQRCLEYVLATGVEQYYAKGVVPRRGHQGAVPPLAGVPWLQQYLDTHHAWPPLPRDVRLEPTVLLELLLGRPVPLVGATEVCLFAKAAGLYLFPELDKNPYKHMVLGHQLLQWWVAIVDRAVSRMFGLEAECRLVVPGAESVLTKRYFPAGSALDWKVGSIFDHGKADSPAVYRVPLFPDDPKGRFLEHIVVEQRAQLVGLAAFWAELSGRQEFRLGDTVGVVGVRGKVRTGPALGLVAARPLCKRQYVRALRGLCTTNYAEPGLVEEEWLVFANQFPHTLERVCGCALAAEPVAATSAPRPANDLSSMVRKRAKVVPRPQ